MLNYDPQLRIKPYDALQHPFFRRSDSTTRHHSSSTAAASPSSGMGKSEASQPISIAANGVTNSTSQVYLTSYQHVSLQASSAPGSLPSDASLFLESSVSQSSYQHATRVFNNPVSSQLSAQTQLTPQQMTSLQQQQLPDQLSSSNMSIDTASNQPAMRKLSTDQIDASSLGEQLRMKNLFYICYILVCSIL